MRIFQTAGPLRYFIRCTVHHMLHISALRGMLVADTTYKKFAVWTFRGQGVDSWSFQSWWIYGKHLYANETASHYSPNSALSVKKINRRNPRHLGRAQEHQRVENRCLPLRPMEMISGKTANKGYKLSSWTEPCLCGVVMAWSGPGGSGRCWRCLRYCVCMALWDGGQKRSLTEGERGVCAGGEKKSLAFHCFWIARSPWIFQREMAICHFVGLWHPCACAWWPGWPQRTGLMKHRSPRSGTCNVALGFTHLFTSHFGARLVCVCVFLCTESINCDVE